MAQQGVPRLRKRPRLPGKASWRGCKSPSVVKAQEPAEPAPRRGQPGEWGDLPAPRPGVGRPSPPGLQCSTGRRGRGPGEGAVLEDKAMVSGLGSGPVTHLCPLGGRGHVRERSRCMAAVPPALRAMPTTQGPTQAGHRHGGHAGPWQGPPGDALWGHDGPATARASGIFREARRNRDFYVTSQKP